MSETEKSNKIIREIEEEKRQRVETRERERKAESWRRTCFCCARVKIFRICLIFFFLSWLIGYWVGPYIKKVSIKYGRVPRVGGWWNRIW